MNFFRIVIVLYFLISVLVIHMAARILSRASATFLLESFHGKSDLIRLVDRVIIASFFLANVGFVVTTAPYTYFEQITTRQVLVTMLDKLGAAMLFVGFTLFLGLWVFARMRGFREPNSVTR